MKSSHVRVPLVALASCFFYATGFPLLLPLSPRAIPNGRISQSGSSSRSLEKTKVNLIPVSKFRNEIPFFAEPDARLCINEDGTFRVDGNNNAYELCLVEEKDLPDLSRFIVTVFGADAVRLSQDLNAFEQLLMKPAAELLNGYSGIIAFVEVLSGLRQRLHNRLTTTMDISPPKIRGLDRRGKIQTSAKSSLLLVLARPTRKREDDWHIDVIASVELRLEICDAKIPFTLPWLDHVERQIASAVGLGKNMAFDLKPYLSSLCVDEQYRGKNIGRALVRCVEDIAAYWGYSRIYLHVDPDNKAAYDLYKSENYYDVGKRWNPFWAGNAAKIAYLCKNLDKRTAKRSKIVEDSLFLAGSEENVNSPQKNIVVLEDV